MSDLINESLQDNPMTYYMEPNGQYSHFNPTPYDVNTPIYIKKANIMIKRIGTSTLFSEKLMLAAIATAKLRKPTDIIDPERLAFFKSVNKKIHTDFTKGLVSEFSNEDIRKWFKIKSSKYYTDINELMNKDLFMSHWSIMVADEDIIGTTYCLTGTVYDKKTGRTYIKWNDDLIDQILCTNGNGTMLSIEMMGGFKNLQSFNAYQLFKEEISYHEYIHTKIRKQKPLIEYCTTFSLAQFRFLIALNQVKVKPDENDEEYVKKVRELIKQKRYDEAEQILIDNGIASSYTDWYEFNRSSLRSISKAINGFEQAIYKDDIENYENKCAETHQTDIHFRYEEIKNRSKVIGIRVFIRWDNTIVEPCEEDEDKTRFFERFKDEICAILHKPITEEDLNTLLKLAGDDTVRLKKACNYTANYKGEIKKPMAFLTAAIKRDYTGSEDINANDNFDLVSLDEIELKYNPDNTLIEKYNVSLANKNIIFSTMYMMLNTTSNTISISRRLSQPTEYVVGIIKSLIPEEIAFINKKMVAQINSGKQLTQSYIKTMLINAKIDYAIYEAANKVYEGINKENLDINYNQSKYGGRNVYHQRIYTDEQYKELELRKLRQSLNIGIEDENKGEQQ